MKISDVVIAAVWIFSLSNAFFITRRIEGTPGPRPEFAIFALVFSFFGAFAIAYLQRHRICEGGRFAGWIDWKWGAGTYTNLIERFRPTALMTLYCLAAAISGLAFAYENAQPWHGYFSSAFALSMGLGFLTAYLLSRKFPPKLP